MLDSWRSALGPTAFGIVLFVLGIFAFVLWVMWLIFPLVVYLKMTDLQARLYQLHGDLVEANGRLKDLAAPRQSSQTQGYDPLA